MRLGENYTMITLLRRFLTGDDGQDLIEYALLSSLIGVVGVLAWNNIVAGILAAYTGWDTGVQGISACTPDPGGGGC